MSVKTYSFANLMEERDKKIMYDAYSNMPTIFPYLSSGGDYVPQKIRWWTRLRWWIGGRMYSVAVRFNPSLPSDDDY